MMKRNVLMDGNGSDTVMIEGLGLHVPMSQVRSLQAEVERLRGVTPELPPRPPEGEGLPRYGLRWNGPNKPLTVPMDDGYWTPWHLAKDLVQECQRLRTANLDSVAVCEQALQAKTTAEQERDKLKAQMAEIFTAEKICAKPFRDAMAVRDAVVIERIRDKWMALFETENEVYTQIEIIDALDVEIEQLRQQAKEG